MTSILPPPPRVRAGFFRGIRPTERFVFFRWKSNGLGAGEIGSRVPIIEFELANRSDLSFLLFQPVRALNQGILGGNFSMKRIMFCTLLLGVSALASTGAAAADFCTSFTFTGLTCASGTLSVNFGTTAGTVVQGNDTRLDTRIAALDQWFADTGDYVGNRTEGDGNVVLNNYVGYRGGRESCVASYANSHPCSPDELAKNVREGNNLASAANAFVLVETPFVEGSDNLQSSWRASCGGYTYNSGDLATHRGATRFTLVSNVVDGAAGSSADQAVFTFTNGAGNCAGVIPCCKD